MILYYIALQYKSFHHYESIFNYITQVPCIFTNGEVFTYHTFDNVMYKLEIYIYISKKTPIIRFMKNIKNSINSKVV